MSRKDHRESKKKKLTTLVGFMVLVVMILGILVPLIIAIMGSSSYEINAEGTYIFSGNKWVKIDYGSSPWLPTDNSSYIIYFKNINCPHCREFDPHWTEFVKKYSSEINATIIEVVCTYFQLACSEPTALSTFNAFQVTSSPLLVIISNMTLLYYGVPPFNSTELFNFTNNILSKASTTEQSNYDEDRK